MKKRSKLFEELYLICSLLQCTMIGFYCGLVTGAKMVDQSFKMPLWVGITCFSIFLVLAIAGMIFSGLSNKEVCKEALASIDVKKKDNNKDTDNNKAQ